MSASRNWALAAHVSATATQLVLPSFGFLGPLIVWVVKSDDRDVRWHAQQALFFQLGMSALAWVMGIVGGLSCFFWFVALAAVVPWIAGLAVPILAGARAYAGERWEYPLTGPLVPA